MGLEEQTLSECELLVMKVIWNSDEELSIQEITERVNREYGREWKQQTVSVFLGRIVKKQLLVSKRQGRVFFYRPTISEEEYGKREILKCMDSWGDGRADLFFAALSRAHELTEEEKSRIRRMLSDLDQ